MERRRRVRRGLRDRVLETIAAWDGVLLLRPLLSLALLVALGTSLGMAFAELRALGPCVVAGLATLALLAHRRALSPSARASTPRAGPWALVVLGLALLHGHLAPGRPRPAEVVPEVVTRTLLGARDEGIAGRWRSLGSGERGWVQAAGLAQPALADRILFECELVAPRDGDRVLVLPGSEVVPWPRGPVPGPAWREGRFLARSSIAPEELVVFPECAPSAGHALAGFVREGLAPLRRALLARARRLESDGPARGLVSALLLGDRSELNGASLDRFTRTGTRHLLALSGLHVGLVGGTLLLPLTGCLLWLPVRGRGRERLRHLVTALRLALLVAYVLAAGLSDPVTRAGAALGLALFAPLLRTPGGAPWERGRAPDGLSIWGAALLLEALVDPLGLRGPSLRLSYLATLGILVGARPVLGALRSFASGGSDHGSRRGAELRRLGVVPPAAALALSVLAVRAWGLLLAGVAASVAAVAATFPEVAARFGEWSPLGVLATPLLVPPITALLVTGWLGVAVELPGLQHAPAALAEGILAALELVDRLPGTPVAVPPRPAALLWLLLGLLAFAAWRRRAAPRGPTPLQRRALGLAARLGALLLLPWSAAPATLELVALEVGHGTCVVARAPGMPALVFDAGSRSRPGIHREALGPLLASWEVTRPWVALTHDHRDHRSDLLRLVERSPPRGWIGALPADLARRLPPDAPRVDAELGAVSVALGSVHGRVLRGRGGGGNEGSRSLELDGQGRRVLLTGDAEGPGLGRQLSERWLVGPVDLLLFPHHGSRTPHCGALLDRLRPREVWLSVDRVPPVAGELQRRGIPLGHTGTTGVLRWRAGDAPGPRAGPGGDPRAPDRTKRGNLAPPAT